MVQLMTQTKSAILGLAVLAALGLAACAGAPPERPKVNLEFEGKPKIALPASQIEFVDLYKPPLASPHVEHDHEWRPSHLMRAWLNSRLAPDPSAPGKIIVTVREASVIEKGVPTEEGLSGALKRETERTLTGRLDWTIAYEGPEINWQTNAYAESVRSIPEQATLNEVDRAYNSIIEALSGHLDQRIEDQVRGLNEARAAQPPM